MTALQFRVMADILRRGETVHIQSIIDALMAAAKLAESSQKRKV